MTQTRTINRLPLLLGMGIAMLGLLFAIGLLLGTSTAHAADFEAGITADAGLDGAQFGDFGAGDAGFGGGGFGDAGTGDAGLGGAGFGDAGTGDAGLGGAGFGDAGTGDAGLGGAGFGDAGTGDAGFGDAGTGDAGTSGFAFGHAFGHAGTGYAGSSGNAGATAQAQGHNTFTVEVTAKVDGQEVSLDQIPAGAEVELTITVTNVSATPSTTRIGCVAVEIPDGFDYVNGSLNIAPEAFKSGAASWHYDFHEGTDGGCCPLSFTNDSVQACVQGPGNAAWGQCLHTGHPFIEITFTATAPAAPGDYQFMVHAWLAQKPGGGGGNPNPFVACAVEDVWEGDGDPGAPIDVTVPDGNDNGNGYGDLALTTWGFDVALQSICSETFTVDFDGKKTTVAATADGVLCRDCLAHSADELHSLFIESQTQVLDSQGNPVELIEITPTDAPELPLNTVLVRQAYDFQPSGTTFDRQTTLTLGHHVDDLPDDAVRVLMAYHGADGEWTEIDTEATQLAEMATLEGLVNHFTVFATLAEVLSK